MGLLLSMPFATNSHISHICFVFFNLRVLRNCDFKTLAEFVWMVRCYGCAYCILSLILLNEILPILTSSL